MSWCFDFIGFLSIKITAFARCKQNFATLGKILSETDAASVINPTNKSKKKIRRQQCRWQSTRLEKFLHFSFFNHNQTRKKKLLTLFKHFDWILERAKGNVEQFLLPSYDVFIWRFPSFWHIHITKSVEFSHHEMTPWRWKETYWQHELLS